MNLLALSDKKLIKNFLESAGDQAGAEFLASLEWTELLKSEGENVELFGVYQESELLAIFNLIRVRGLYNYLPRGPVFKLSLSPTEQKNIWEFLNSTFKKQGLVFWRVEPKEMPLINYTSSKNLQPKETLMLDLDLSETELLSSFHPKTRYNIKLAEKKGVSVRAAQSEADFKIFWNLMTETGERDAFKIHNQKHYQTLATQNPDFIKLFLAEVNGQVIAAGLFSFYGNKVTYLHGASAHAARQFMAPFLLQWTLIKLAKSKNYKYYDFYGIDDQMWPGVTRFKLGFSGRRISYAGTLDIILNKPKYHLYNLLRRLKRFL